jgi:beta-N-acetylhexosaminidase
LAYVAGQSLAIDLRHLGFNMNLAPVLDVNSNPKNPVIGIRSYGEKPELVGELGSWYIRGQQEMGVIAVAKHFPGHGDTQSDSHFGMPSIDASMERLEQIELMPFARALEAGLDVIMTAHIALPQVAESPDVPATLSKQVLTGILRRKMGFEGVVVTDGLEMQGIVDQYGSGRAAILAVLAGADMPMILWTPRKKEEVFQSLLSAVRSGEISIERLNQSVRRILTIKARHGLFNNKLEPVEVVLQNHNYNPIHAQVAQRIAREAVTLVRNHANLLPLRTVRYHKIVAVAPPGPFALRLAQEPNIKVIEVPYVPSRERREKVADEAVAEGQDADLFVFAAINRYHIEIAKTVTEALQQTPAALLSFASPYYLAYMPNVDAYVCTYSYLDGAQAAAAEAVLGQTPTTGRLPVSIPGFYPYGYRVEESANKNPPASASASARP